MQIDRRPPTVTGLIQIGMLLAAIATGWLGWQTAAQQKEEAQKADAERQRIEAIRQRDEAMSLQHLTDVVDELKRVQASLAVSDDKRAAAIEERLRQAKAERDAELTRMEAERLRAEQQQAERTTQLMDRVNQLTNAILSTRPRGMLQDFTPLPTGQASLDASGPWHVGQDAR